MFAPWSQAFKSQKAAAAAVAALAAAVLLNAAAPATALDTSRVSQWRQRQAGGPGWREGGGWSKAQPRLSSRLGPQTAAPTAAALSHGLPARGLKACHP